MREMASFGDDPGNFYGESNIELVLKDGKIETYLMRRSLPTEEPQ